MEEMECSEEFLELAHKMRAEQEEYRVWLMSQPPEIIHPHAAEWAAREDVLSRLDELVLDGKETKEYNCGHNIPCDDLLFLSLRFLLIQTNTIPT